jgi:hypothetical protein
MNRSFQRASRNSDAQGYPPASTTHIAIYRGTRRPLVGSREPQNTPVRIRTRTTNGKKMAGVM